MNPKDPLLEIEKLVKDIHDRAGTVTDPVIRRYPLLFGFLIVFSVAAILHGFELFADSIHLFEEKPLILILIGVVLLIFTGRLYKNLQ